MAVERTTAYGAWCDRDPEGVCDFLGPWGSEQEAELGLRAHHDAEHPELTGFESVGETVPSWFVHNHGTEEGEGLACRETRRKDGALRGACMSDPKPSDSGGGGHAGESGE